MSDTSRNDWKEVPKEYQQDGPPPPAGEHTAEMSSSELEEAINDIRKGIESAAAKVSSWWKTKGEQETSDFLDQAEDKIKRAAELVKAEVDETVKDVKTQPPKSRESVIGKLVGEVETLFNSRDKPERNG
ncbi:MAG: hypothetical protein GXY37_03530 [Chloroflexi bacterium]|nr:hypothetical protein [Chloroflexota bacterium]